MSTPDAAARRLDDRQQLHKLGYAQELFRSMGGFQNFAISFTIISILAGCLTSYAIAFNQGGPVAITWGWLIVGLFCIFVALAHGRDRLDLPDGGRPLLLGVEAPASPGWGWFTGWFNLVGQIAVTAAIGFGCAIFMTSRLNLITVGSYGNTYHWIYLTYAFIMLARRADQHAQGADHGRAERVLGLVAHDRRAVHRRRPDRRPRPPSVGRLRLRQDDQQHRLRRGNDARARLLLRLPDRPAAGPVHDHGLRRLGAHERGDAQAPRSARPGAW